MHFAKPLAGRTSLALGFFLALSISEGLVVRAQTAPSDVAAGQKLFRANCAGCHKWHGGGGGGYGGDALSLRKTKLDRAAIIETIGCGRPGTGMPYHLRDAYENGACYGLKENDVANGMALAANNFLRPTEIAAIADYVIANVKGRGEPNYAECVAFFGTGSRVCNIYGDQRTAGAATK